jgi:hypothetical protein
MRVTLRNMFAYFTGLAIQIGMLTLAFTGQSESLTSMATVCLVVIGVMTGIDIYRRRKS